MLAGEGAAAGERLDGALDVDRVVRQLALGLRRVGGEHADAAVDVELRVTERRTGPRGDGVELVAVLAQVPAERLEQRGPLVERQRAQRGTADGAAVVEDGTHVDAGGGDPGHLLTGDRVVQRAPLAVGAYQPPLT